VNTASRVITGPKVSVVSIQIPVVLAVVLESVAQLGCATVTKRVKLILRLILEIAFAGKASPDLYVTR